MTTVAFWLPLMCYLQEVYMEWLIEVTGLPFDILILVLLAVAGAFAGFVDSIVGGGLDVVYIHKKEYLQ